MNETKFTKGPWVISNSGSAYMEGTIILTSDGYREIAGVWQDEDAHLISAAPDLYDALQRLIPSGLDPYTHNMIMSDPSHYVNLALAKARGEE